MTDLNPVLAAEYLIRGWRITPYSRLDIGMVTGPCAGCDTTTVVYGPRGNPLCATCRSRVSSGWAGRR